VGTYVLQLAESLTFICAHGNRAPGERALPWVILHDGLIGIVRGRVPLPRGALYAPGVRARALVLGLEAINQMTYD